MRYPAMVRLFSPASDPTGRTEPIGESAQRGRCVDAKFVVATAVAADGGVSAGEDRRCSVFRRKHRSRSVCQPALVTVNLIGVVMRGAALFDVTSSVRSGACRSMASMSAVW
jgi:hypothetical protein